MPSRVWGHVLVAGRPPASPAALCSRCSLPPQRAQYQDKLARQRYDDQLRQQVSRTPAGGRASSCSRRAKARAVDARVGLGPGGAVVGLPHVHSPAQGSGHSVLYRLHGRGRLQLFLGFNQWHVTWLM